MLIFANPEPRLFSFDCADSPSDDDLNPWSTPPSRFGNTNRQGEIRAVVAIVYPIEVIEEQPIFLINLNSLFLFSTSKHLLQHEFIMIITKRRERESSTGFKILSVDVAFRATINIMNIDLD